MFYVCKQPKSFQSDKMTFRNIRQKFTMNKRQRLDNGGSFAVKENNGFVKDDEIQKHRKSLPVYSVRWKLLQEIRKYYSVIIIGETGCGKTTQIPQYLYETGIHQGGVIGITQPRRVAAITISSRVAKEMCTTLGQTVGYCVRFEDTTSSSTKLKYLTDGMLLREAILDPLLKRYSVIILDEAHERTIHTEVLFGVIKAAQSERQSKSLSPLKIIIMSATMDVDHFSKYFNKAPVLYLEGRQFPVQVMYSKEVQNDYLFSAMVTVFQIHQSAPAQHDVLVFLTGQDEIESMAKTIRMIAKSLPNDCPSLKVCPLYAALPSHSQMIAFNPTPRGCRKVILATNIAETSITVSGIKFVVDTGMVKARTYVPSTGLDMLIVQKISKAQAWQRSGRAGRDSSGTCYRTYTEAEFEKLKEFSVPEIQRCNLSGVLLELLAVGITDVLNFDFMDKPSQESLISALDILQIIGAVEKENQHFKLTNVGKQMSAFPLDPRFAKILLASKDYGCTEEILSIIALLSVESVMFTPQTKREEAIATRQKFISSEGDHLTVLNIFKAYRSANGNKQWCHENYVHQRNLQMATEVRKQLHELCKKMALPVRSCGQDTSAIRKSLMAGLFMNIAELQRDGSYLTLDSRQNVHIHPSSVLFRCKPDCVIFTELIKTAKCYMRTLSIVDGDWLTEVVPSFVKKSARLGIKRDLSENVTVKSK